MFDSEDIQKQIDALDYSIELLKDRRTQLRQELYSKEWKENRFANDKQTKRIAEFFRALGFVIVDLKSDSQNEDDLFYRLAKQIWEFYKTDQRVKDFIKELSKIEAKTTFLYPTDTWGHEERNRLNNLCKTMQDNRWITINKSEADTVLNVTSRLTPETSKFLDGGWAESITRFLINKTFSVFIKKRKMFQKKIFWNVQIKRFGSVNANDMELDVVVELNGRFYIFETKSGVIEFRKMFDKADLFDRDGESRFILCSLDEKWRPYHFKPHLLYPLPELEERWKLLLSKDFKGEIAETDTIEA